MNDPFFVYYFDSFDHLNRDMKDWLEVKFSSALLEQVLQRFSKHVHDHNVIHLSIFGFLISNEMEIWYRCFAPQFMDQFRFPKEHNMLLIFDSFLNLGS